MPDHEIFPNPVAKQVAFEVRFPNLFFIEGKIGDFQVRVMKDFPLSELILRRNFMFVTSPGTIPDLSAKPPEDSPTDKVWQFRSHLGTSLQVSSNNLVLVSQQHHSYHHGGDNSFRAVISRVVGHFIDMVKIPVVLRIGLRYTNECPVFDRTTERFNECYDSILPVNRFGLNRLANADCIVVAKFERCQMRHIESLRLVENKDHLVLDLDAWMENVPVDRIVESADVLHEVIAEEFRHAIKEPIVKFMRRPKGEN